MLVFILLKLKLATQNLKNSLRKLKHLILLLQLQKMVEQKIHLNYSQIKQKFCLKKNCLKLLKVPLVTLQIKELLLNKGESLMLVTTISFLLIALLVAIGNVSPILTIFTNVGIALIVLFLFAYIKAYKKHGYKETWMKG